MKKIIIIVVILVLILGAGGFFAWKTLGAKASDAEKKPEMNFESLLENQVSMAPITTNLLSPNHYIVIAFDVQTSDAKAKEEFELRLSEMKSIAISTFNSSKLNELNAENGTKQLVDSLKKQYNDKMKNGEVTDIYITDFKLQ